MSYLTWDALFNPGATQIATVNDLQLQLRASGILTQVADQVQQNVVLENIMATCAADMKERCILRFQDKYPESVAYYSGVYQNALRQLNSQLYPTGFPNFGYITTLGNFVNYEGQHVSDDPQVFLSLGAPDNSRFNGAAYNGAFCIDTTPSGERMFVNKGTKDANSWDAWSDQGLVDFLINPQSLKRAFIYGSIYFMFEDRATNDILGNFKNVEMYALQEERYRLKYKDLIDRALSILDVDYSNRGYVTSLGMRSQKKQWGIR